MLTSVLRDRKKPLQFPILMDFAKVDEAETPDGWIGFPRGTLFRAVWAVEPKEIWRRLDRIFRGNERDLWNGLLWLRIACKKWNEEKLRQASEMVRPWIQKIPGSRIDEPFETRWERARWFHATLLSSALENARLVTWWVEGKERLIAPAVYCPDWKTAAFVALWRGGIKICPWCEQPFVPEKENQDFCTAKHGASWRTARSREKKRRAEAAKTTAKRTRR